MYEQQFRTTPVVPDFFRDDADFIGVAIPWVYEFCGIAIFVTR